MRKFLALCMVAFCTTAWAADQETEYEKRLLRAIYLAEGGAKARVPYGILSIRVADASEARRACLVTIRNNRRRWAAAGRKGDYLAFLARRYCPPAPEVWLKNVRYFMKKKIW